MNERVLAAEAKDAKRHVLDSGTRCLSVNQVSEYKKNLQYFLYEDILYIALVCICDYLYVLFIIGCAMKMLFIAYVV